MHKTLSLLAVLSAIVSPALADLQDVTLSGTVQASSLTDGKNYIMQDGTKLIITGNGGLFSNILIQGNVTFSAEPSTVVSGLSWGPCNSYRINFADASAKITITLNSTAYECMAENFEASKEWSPVAAGYFKVIEVPDVPHQLTLSNDVMAHFQQMGYTYAGVLDDISQMQEGTFFIYDNSGETISVYYYGLPGAGGATAKSMAETRANAVALVNGGADFMVTTGLAQAKAAAKATEGAWAPFVALGGSHFRYNTGSHVDADAFHAALGMAKQFNDTVFGAAGEYGQSDYTGAVSNVRSNGDAKMYGAAIFGEHTFAHGWHADAALRGGKLHTDYSSAAAGHYSDSALYHSASIGGGKLIKLRKTDDSIDVYARYFYSHTDSSKTVSTKGTALHFDGSDSHRTMVGARYNHELTDNTRVYAGAAWMHEFDGDADALIGSKSAPAPSLKGNSCMVELGTTIAPFDSKNILMNLNVQGWTGVQRGISGGAGCTIKF